MDVVRAAHREVPWLTIGEVIRAKARERADRDAVAFGLGQRLTYAALDARSDWLAGAFTELGVRKGDRVASLLPNSPEQLLTWLAAAKLGAIAVPLNVSLRGADLGHVLREAAPTVFLTDQTLRPVYESARGEGAPRLAAEIMIGEPTSGYLGFDQLETAQRQPPAVEVSPSDAVCILFTGGTTGLPKGVLRSHFSYICAAVRYAEIFRPTSDDRHFASMHLFHCGGQEISFLGPVFNNVPTMIPRWFSARDYWTQVRAFGGTIIEALGSLVAVLLRQPPQPDDRDHPVRVAVGATQSVSAETRSEFEKRFGVRLLEVYALTETGTLLISNHLDDERAGSVGKPRGWGEVAVVDELDRPRPPGQVGEIVIRPTLPYSMSMGYYGRPDATLERWRNLWIHTGDLGYLDDDGWLYFTGRMAYWIRRRGENVSSLEVEQVIDAHPRVVESAAVGVPSELGEEDIKACVVLQAGTMVSPDEIVRWCEDRLAYFKVPRYVEFTGQLPRSAAKSEIERHTLKAQGIGQAWDREAAGYQLRR
jgi:crotonobetaine/carnitine-CoA ligase